MIRTIPILLLVLSCTVVLAQLLNSDPFTPIETNQEVITVNFLEFATIPNTDGGEAPRLMHMITEPGTQRLFVSTMPGRLYSLSFDGLSVVPYIDIDTAGWNVDVMSAGPARPVMANSTPILILQGAMPLQILSLVVIPALTILCSMNGPLAIRQRLPMMVGLPGRSFEPPNPMRITMAGKLLSTR